MENMCNVGHLDADALLPPRKRLLAGLKRQNSDVSPPMPLPTIYNAVRENGVSYKDIYGCQLGTPNCSDKEIVEASRIAAIEAAKVAEAARANAEEKAAKAAKAVAVAKSALELVVALSVEGDDEIILKKNKMKKHVPIEALYNTNKCHINCRTDEELARKLHRVINSSPRILKNTSSSDLRNQKHKRPRNSALSGRTSMGNGVAVGIGNITSIATSNGDNTVEEVCTGDSMNMLKPGKVDQLTSDNGNKWEPNKPDRLKLVKGEAKALHSKNKFTKSLDSSGKKRGRIKQKKLPLSICNFRDQIGPKEKDNAVRTSMGNQSVLSMGFSGKNLMPIERKTMWKCESLKTPACVKQNKVAQS